MIFGSPRRGAPASIYEAAKRHLDTARCPWETKPSASRSSTNIHDRDGAYLANFHIREDAELAALAPDLALALTTLCDALDNSLEEAQAVMDKIKQPRRRYGAPRQGHV